MANILLTKAVSLYRRRYLRDKREHFKRLFYLPLGVVLETFATFFSSFSWAFALPFAPFA